MSQSVFRPSTQRLVALRMCGGCHVQLAAAGEERLAQLRVAAAVADVPLPRRDDLERAIAALVELHRVRDRLRLADQLARLREQLDDARLRLLRGLARELGVARVGLGRRRRPSRGARRARRPSRPDHVAGRQLQLAPPHDVGGVAEGADHRDAGALLGVGERVREHRDRARRTAGVTTSWPKRGA